VPAVGQFKGKPGLADFGKPGHYLARPIERWTTQYRASATARIDAPDRLIARLPAHIPPGAETTIVHGGYRLDNLVFRPSRASSPCWIGSCRPWATRPRIFRITASQDLRARLPAFMDDPIYPNARAFEDEAAHDGRSRGNRWLSTALCEIMGRVPWAPEVFDCCRDANRKKRQRPHHQRPQMVVLARRRPALQSVHRDGQAPSPASASTRRACRP
jgi:hypothetical protein